MHPWVQRRRLPKCIDSGYPPDFGSIRKTAARGGKAAFSLLQGYKWVVVLSNRCCSARYVRRAARAPHWASSTTLSIRSTAKHRSGPVVNTQRLFNVCLRFVYCVFNKLLGGSRLVCWYNLITRLKYFVFLMDLFLSTIVLRKFLLHN